MKRTKQIATRITDETLKKLQNEAEKYKWTISKLTNEILEDWTNAAEQGKTSIADLLKKQKKQN